jgi:UDP-N-acetylmuramyl pentapeptide phosphotransferase/UDP-N-acetylglucosamine-1-phosphate transferase
MFSDFDKYIAVFLTGLVVTYILTPWVRVLACRYQIVDLPGERRPHKHPTARGGGLAVVIGVQAACVMALVFPWPKMAGGLDVHWWLHFSAASLVLLVVGLVDDIRGLGPWPKLGGQAVAGLLVALSGTRFGNFLGYELPGPVDSLLVVVWLVAVINAFNLIDGLDGLASGLAIISATGLCGILLLAHQPADVLVLLGLIGACLAFLRYNFHPATIFLGDTGSMFLGFILGVVSLQTLNKNTFILSMTIPTLVLGVPIYDTLLAVWRRSVRLWLAGAQPGEVSKGKGLMQPDLEHLHHRLLRMGLGTRRVATVLFMTNAGLVAFGLLITTFQSHSAGIFLIALLAGVYLLMRHLAVIELRDTGRALLIGLRRPTHLALKALSYEVWDMGSMGAALALSMWAFEQRQGDFLHAWFLDLPIWVTPTFLLLALSRTYLTVWTRTRMRDVLMLIFLLQGGLLLSLGIALVIDPGNALQWMLRALIVGGVSHPVIVGVRVIYRFVEEVVVWLKVQSEPNQKGERVLLYGAGGRCQLFLKERGFNNSRSFDKRIIVGLIDDEPSLQSRWAYGYLVLGNVNDLPRLIPLHHITGLIITAELKPESRAALREVADRLGVGLTEWGFEERKVGVPVSARVPAPPASGAQLVPSANPSPTQTSSTTAMANI